MSKCLFDTVHRSAFLPVSFSVDLLLSSTGKETGKTHLCAFQEEERSQLANSPPYDIFLEHQFLESVHKSFLNQTTLYSRKEKWSFLNRELIISSILPKNGQKDSTLPLWYLKSNCLCWFFGRIEDTKKKIF